MFKLFEKISGEKIQRSELLTDNPKEKTDDLASRFENKTDPEAEKKAIEKVKEYIKNNDGHIDPETIEMITGKSIDEVFKSLANQKLELNLEQLKSSISQTIDDMDNKPSVLEFFRKKFKKPVAKASFVALMLFLKFAPDLQAMEKGDEIKAEDKKEAKANKYDNINDENTYQATSEDFSENNPLENDKLDLKVDMVDLERAAKFDLTNYYATDKAEIADSDKVEIAENFKLFLDQINQDNFEEIMARVFEIIAHSDQRETSREGGNQKLSEDRAVEVLKILNDVLRDYNFEKLTDEQIEQLKSKGFVINIPEGGVKKLTDLINKDTGKNYTEEEINNLSQAEKELLLAECRGVSFNLLAKKVDQLEKMPTKAAELIIERINPIDNLDNFGDITVAVDNSPSMNRTAEFLAKKMAQQEVLDEAKIKFTTFSDRVGKIQEIDNLNDLTEKVIEMPKNGSERELAIHAIINILQGMSDVEDNDRDKIDNKRLLILYTDEPIQEVNLDLLYSVKEQAEQKNCEISIVYGSTRSGEKAQSMNIYDLIDAYENSVLDKYSSTFLRRVNAQERQLELAEGRLERLQSSMGLIIERDRNGSNQERIRDMQAERVALENEKVSGVQELSKMREAFDSGDLAEIIKIQMFYDLLKDDLKNTRNIDPRTLGENILLKE